MAGALPRGRRRSPAPSPRHSRCTPARSGRRRAQGPPDRLRRTAAARDPGTLEARGRHALVRQWGGLLPAFGYGRLRRLGASALPPRKGAGQPLAEDVDGGMHLGSEPFGDIAGGGIPRAVAGLQGAWTLAQLRHRRRNARVWGRRNAVRPPENASIGIDVLSPSVIAAAG